MRAVAGECRGVGKSGPSEPENFISSQAWDLEDTPSLFSSSLLKDNFNPTDIT